MKYVGLMVVCFLLSCSHHEDEMLRLRAELVYLKTKGEEITDAEGKRFFQNLTKEEASRLYDGLSERLRQLELDDTDPQTL